MGQRQSRRSDAEAIHAKTVEAVRQTASEFEEACCVCEKGRFMSLTLYRTAFWNYAYHKMATYHSDRHKEQLPGERKKRIHELAMAHCPDTQGRDVSLSLNPSSVKYVLGMDLVRFPTVEIAEESRARAHECQEHREVTRRLRQVYFEMEKMKDDEWTQDHLSRLNTNVERIIDFIGDASFPAFYSVHAKIPPGPATVDHAGLVGLLDEANRWLFRGDAEAWDSTDLQLLYEVAWDLQDLSDDMYHRSEYTPPWC